MAKKLPIIGVVLLAAAFLIPLFYGVSYLLCLKADGMCEIYEGGTRTCLRVASYRLDSPRTQAFFAPAEWLDRRIRPSFWERTEEVVWPRDIQINDDE